MSSLTLRAIACVCMLLDHIAYAFSWRYPALAVFRWLGRLAFPLYCFLVVEGFRHTSNRPRYALRLALFALLSQIPFSLFFKHTLLSPHLNVLVTLLLCLIVLWVTDELRKHKTLRYFSFIPTLCLVALYYFGGLESDYGARGILLALCFYLLSHRSLLLLPGMLLATYWDKLLSLAFGLFCVLRGRPFVFTGLTSWDYIQLFSLLALIPIWLYNGKRGQLPKNPVLAKCIQFGFYGFYPLHLIVLYWLR